MGAFYVFGEAHLIERIIAELAATGIGEFTGAFQAASASVLELGKATEVANGHFTSLSGIVHSAASGIATGVGIIGNAAIAMGEATLRGGIVAGAALTAVGVASTVLAGDYQQNMNRLQVITQASSQTMQDFNKTAINVGKTTVFSSKEAALGMAELAQMGYTAAQTMQLIGPAANAAMINSVSLTEATSTLTSVMHGFGIQANDSQRVLDVMTRASQLGKLSFIDFGKEAENVGLIARAAGQGLEGTTAAMLSLTNTGMSAARASETLRFTFVQMEKPNSVAAKALKELGVSFYDSAGNMRSYADIMGSVQTATANMTEQQRNLAVASIFGKNGILAFNAATNAMANESMPDGTTQILHGKTR
jgi:TP901 family phage tail tape measure protein